MKGWLRFVLVFGGVLSMTACGGNGGGSVTAPPAPPPPPPPPASPDVDVQRVFPNLDFGPSVALKQAPGDGSRWYVVEQRGVVFAFDNDQGVTGNDVDVFIDIAARVDDNASEAGLLGMAFHPDFPTTPEVFFSYTANSGGLISTLSRFRLNNTGQALDPTSEEVLLQIPQPFSNHNGGDVAFGPDGFLYASFGDGGSGGDPQENGQNRANLLGTIIRIDVDGNSPYDIPPDNPFFGGGPCVQGFGGGDCPEIYAYGLRNPWRMSFDSGTGVLWTGDVGQGAWEEVNRIVSGGNYGWDEREGAHCFEPATGCATAGFEEPVAEYDHGVGQSVTGGYVYRGTAVPELVGYYVFGDFVQGIILAVQADTQPTVSAEVIGDAGFNISAFAEDVNGELYALNYGGTIFQIIAAP